MEQDYSDVMSLKLNNETSVVEHILGAPAAALVDMGTTMWNSLVPERYEVDTYDFLAGINENLASIYNQDRDAVKTMSFLGGIFIPQGIALKGMNYLRSGMKGANWFSKAGEAERLANIKSAWEGSAQASTVAKNLIFQNRVAAVGNALVDASAMELAFVATMNAHPYMEDYIKNPWKSAGKSLALGTGLMGVSNLISAGRKVKDIKMAVEGATQEEVVKGFAGPLEETFNSIQKLKWEADTITNWKNALNTKPDLTIHTKSALEYYIKRLEADQFNILDSMMSAGMKKVIGEDKLPAYKQNLLDQILNNDSFTGGEKIFFPKIEEYVPIVNGTKPANYFGSTSFAIPEIPLADYTKKGGMKPISLMYDPQTGNFMTINDLVMYGKAADLGVSANDLLKGIPSNWHKIPDEGYAFMHDSLSTPHQELRFLQALMYYDKLPTSELYNVAIGKNDIAQMNGLLRRIERELADPKSIFELDKFKAVVTASVPKWGDVNVLMVQEALKKELEKVTTITNTVQRTATTTTTVGTTVLPKVNPNIINNILDDLRRNTHSYDLMLPQNGLSNDALTLAHAFSGTTHLNDTLPFGGMHLVDRGLGIWRRGAKSPQRLFTEEEALVFGNKEYKAFRAQGLSHEEALQQYITVMRNGLPVSTTVGEDVAVYLGSLVEELYNSKASQQLRAYLRTQADSEGYVYLWRGSKNPLKGSRGGESFTPSIDIAQVFGTPNLYRINVDDIIGHVGSYAGSTFGGELEFIVDSATHPVITTLPTGEISASVTTTKVPIKLSTDKLVDIIKNHTQVISSEGIDYTQLKNLTTETQKTLALKYLSKGIQPEVVASHTNLNLQDVIALRSDPNHVISQGMKFGNPAEVDSILDPANRAFGIATTKPMINVAQMRAVQNVTSLNNIDDLTKLTFFKQSASTLLKDLVSYFGSDDFTLLKDILRKGLDKITNASLGTKFFGSSDFALRDLGDINPAVTQLGKTFTHLHTEAVKKMMGVLGDDVFTVARNPVLRTEHNTALSVYNSIKGEVAYDNGIFYYIDKEAPTKQVIVNGKEVTVKNWIPAEYKGNVFEIQNEEVKKLFDAYQKLGRDFYSQEKTRRSILGLPALKDRGFWIPAYNPMNKHIAYSIDPVTQEVKVILGKTSEDLQNLLTAYKRVNPTHEVLTHGDEQKFYNILRGRDDPLTITPVDTAQLHGGSSSSAIISTSAEQITDIVQAYTSLLNRNVKYAGELMLSDIMNTLQGISDISTHTVRNQPLTRFKMFEKKPKDIGLTLRNTILGNNNLNETPLWKGTNDTFEFLSEKLLTTIQDIVSPIFGKGRFAKSDEEYKVLVDAIQAGKIPNVFEGFTEAEAKGMVHSNRIVRTAALTPQVTALANTLAATTLLRFGEFTQAYVNAISLPILMTSKLSAKMPQEYAGFARATDILEPTRNMYNGFRFAHSQEGKRLLDYAVNKGYISLDFNEADELFKALRDVRGGNISAIKKAIESKIVTTLSSATDFSEKQVRKYAFSTGLYVAKKYYPGITDSGAMMYARQFTDQVIGNYTAAQRPTMFQGTLGMAMGLFQTYMVTLAQAMYGHIEKGEFKALAKMMLAQSTIFGAKSLPGFNIVSNMIGEHFSDQNYDLVTGTYRAFPDKLADFIIYGLPSSFGPAITSRGDIQPRIPTLNSGIDAIPAIGLTINAIDTLKKVALSIPNGGGQGLLEALALQNLSRPIARMSEVLSGYSITQSGQVLQTPNEIWTFNGVATRILGARPLEDAKVRDMWHLNSMYGAVDRDKRQEYTKRLRTYLRSGTLDAETVSDLGAEYMRTGSQAGWNSIVNTAIAQTSVPIGMTLRNHLKPDSPFMAALNDTW